MENNNENNFCVINVPVNDETKETGEHIIKSVINYIIH